MLKMIKKNFRKPKGLFGRLAGKIMAMENKTLNKWTIERLDIRPGDRILEVGYGPGYSIDYITEHYPSVHIDGVDVSKTMRNQASHRLDSEIKAGNVTLYSREVEQASFQDACFQRILIVNNYMLWNDRMAGLRNLYAALVPGGKIAVTMQPREEDAGTGRTRFYGRQIRKDLKTCGFHQIQVRFKHVQPELAVCVTAVKPDDGEINKF